MTTRIDGAGNSRPGDRSPSASAERHDKSPEHGRAERPDRAGARDRQRAEPRTRGDVARAVRGDPPIRPRDAVAPNARDGGNDRQPDRTRGERAADVKRDRGEPEHLAETRSRSEFAKDTRAAQPVRHRETPAHSQKSADAWPPPKADQNRARALYQEYLADAKAADASSGWGQGRNIADAKPDRSPANIDDLPPPGDKLVELETTKKSRFADLLHEAEKEENLDGLHDAVEKYSNTVQEWLTARPPEGHAEQPVPTSPYIAPSVPEHGVDAGNAATAVMVAGIATTHLVRWMNDRLKHGKGDHDGSNR
ncbi:MAG TPA: hypothetical protein VFB06_35570 [Streptosporangiaceae bacterium]|nr:hypothetical protein [Streptosporangiaceae bacterium]